MVSNPPPERVDIEALRALEQAATPGPWVKVHTLLVDDHRLAVAARNALPLLLAELREWRALAALVEAGALVPCCPTCSLPVACRYTAPGQAAEFACTNEQCSHYARITPPDAIAAGFRALRAEETRP